MNKVGKPVTTRVIATSKFRRRAQLRRTPLLKTFERTRSIRRYDEANEYPPFILFLSLFVPDFDFAISKIIKESPKIKDERARATKRVDRGRRNRWKGSSGKL